MSPDEIFHILFRVLNCPLTIRCYNSNDINEANIMPIRKRHNIPQKRGSSDDLYAPYLKDVVERALSPLIGPNSLF